MMSIKLLFVTILFILTFAVFALAQEDTTLTITSEGNIGIGITNPITKLHILGNTPGAIARFEGSQPFLVLNTNSTFQSGIEFEASGVRKWAIFTDTGGNSVNNLSFRDTDQGVTRLFIDHTGQVGIGTTDPREDLEVEGGFSIDGGNQLGLFRIKQEDTLMWTFLTADWIQDDLRLRNEITGVDVMVFDMQANNVGIGTNNPAGKLDVNGTIYQRGNELHADYVFQPGYKLESIEEHAEFMWDNKHLKAIPKARTDAEGREIVEVGSHRKGIVEELEKAHIYIEQLHSRINKLEAKLDKLAMDNGEKQ
jgi:hypothetical protein